MNKNLKMDNSRWKELWNFKKELHKSSEHSRNKLAAQGSSSKLTENVITICKISHYLYMLWRKFQYRFYCYIISWWCYIPL